MINISAEDAKLFQDNGFTKEQVGATINHYREQGLSDDDIQLKINDRLSSFGKAPAEEKKGIDLTPNGLYKKAVVGAVAPLRAAIYKESIPEAYQTGIERLEQFKPAGGIADLAFDTAVYSRLPWLKGASAAGKVGAFAGNAAIQGGIPGLLEGAKEGKALEGARAGTGIAAAINIIPGASKYISKGLANPTFQHNFGKVQELLTSVPSEMSERALQKELAGNSIFKGKFDSKNLNEAYNEAGLRAIAGMKNAEYLANKEIGDALNSLPANSINAPQLITNITKDIDQLSRGGRINPALAEKGDDILQVLGELGDKGNKTVDFHHIKDNLQTKLRNQYGKESGTGINALKGVSAKIRQALNEASPQYAQANANREALYDIKDSLGGMNKKTIASKLRNVEGDANVRAGYSQAAEELENLVAPEFKFLDEVKDLRAREALEQWLPGQGGGFGSSQGAGNLVRNAIGLGTLPTAAATLHNPLLILGSAALSPKLGAKATIQNLGRLNNTAESLQRLLPENVRKLLTPALVQLGIGE
jgi:hypothetical protein